MKQLLLACLVSFVVLPVQAVERFVAGTHYQIVAQDSSREGNKPEVVEFFSYGCPHCEHLEPALNAWYESNKERVDFKRVPAQWSGYFKLLGRLYFTLDELGVAKTHSDAVFAYIHERRKPLRKESQIFSFAEQELGLEPEKFKTVWNSNKVRTRMQDADKALRAYKVSGVPAILVNQRYYVSVKLAGSEEMMFEVVDFLLTK